MSVPLHDYLSAKKAEAKSIIAAKAARKAAIHLVKPSVAPVERPRATPHEIGAKLGARFAALTRGRRGFE